MSVKTAAAHKDRLGKERESGLTVSIVRFVSVFSLSFCLLFVGMSLLSNVYDEGIVLTASMRVANGQIPHRDFYSIYGPAQFYLLATLFKLFGQSIFIERILDLFYRALLVASVYTIACSYMRKPVAACASAITLAWLFALHYGTAGSATIPVSLLNLIGTVLILPIFTRTVSARRIFAAGALSGLSTLFRYDTGVALFCVHACTIAIGICVRLKRYRLRAFVAEFWPYLPGFVAVVLFPASYYLSRAPLAPLYHDVIFFPSHYYYRARNLPFPEIGFLKGLDNFAVYLPIVVVVLSIYVILVDYLRMRDDTTSLLPEKQRVCGFFVAFGLLALAMYFKGFVRISVLQMYLATIPTILLTALLFQSRSSYRRPLQFLILIVVGLSLLSPAWCSLREIRDMHTQHSSLLEHIWFSTRQDPVRTSWCQTVNSLTRGLCFLPEDYRIETIEFIENHTREDQTLFVGVTGHDKIFANDNLIYFATNRLPATRWSHFDPDLQSGFEIQTQMVHELEVNAPPYIVLDSEYGLQQEPNDSSRSSGVTVLDDYLRKEYRRIQTFGQMSIWQRTLGS